MSTNKSLKALYREYIEVVWNQKNLAAMDTYFTEDSIDYDARPGQAPGLAGLKALFGMIQSAFPDWQITIQIVAQEGDLLTARITTSGTHLGHFFGMPATQRKFNSTRTDIFRYRDDKIAEHWGNADDLGMMQQLGAIQIPGM